LDPGALDKIVSKLEMPSHPDLIIGLEHPDDAGVFRLSDETAIVQTLDFLTPVADDPYDFGQIAAANSLSDVYAMGGTPVTVMNIVCFPSCDLDAGILPRILEGGLDKIKESGAALVGGHSVDDPEIKYGLSVTGIVHPDKVWANSRAKTGDAVILTKPIGSGIISTAIKGGLASDDQIKQAVKNMSTLNKYAALIAKEFDVHACTDVTGFGLGGHLIESAKGAGVRIEIYTEKVGVLDGVMEFAAMGLFPAGAHKNKRFFESQTRVVKGTDLVRSDLLFDPQTSGGLLLFMPREQAVQCADIMGKKGIPASLIGRVKGPYTNGFLDIM
jgi:selenide,water dikinase